jgi:hypothetical protein
MKHSHSFAMTIFHKITKSAKLVILLLKKFGADIFFDDQHKHCQSAAEYVPAGHVPNGIINK